MNLKQLSKAWFGIAAGIGIQATFNLPLWSVVWLMVLFTVLGIIAMEVENSVGNEGTW